jgi:hypothetical protein
VGSFGILRSREETNIVVSVRGLLYLVSVQSLDGLMDYVALTLRATILLRAGLTCSPSIIVYGDKGSDGSSGLERFIGLSREML